jgi:hypothetical protein
LLGSVPTTMYHLAHALAAGIVRASTSIDVQHRRRRRVSILIIPIKLHEPVYDLAL